MELVDKWETEGKITEANRNNIARYLNFLRNKSHLNQML